MNDPSILHSPRLAAASGDGDNSTVRLLKFLQATPDQRIAIDNILEGKLSHDRESINGPLLYGMTAAARFLGVSRATLWRMIRAGILRKIEVLPGSYRVRRADLEAIASGRTISR